MDKTKVAEALKLISEVVRSTRCPDPGEGGCIGGPVPGYGCLNEAAWFVLHRLEEGQVEIAIEVLELIKAKMDGRTEVVAALNLLHAPEG